MHNYFNRNPLHLYVGLVAGLFVFGVVARPLVDLLVPGLAMMGLRVTINWMFVALVVALVGVLGWWGKVRLTAPIAAGGRRYLVVLAALVVVPMAVTLLLVPNALAVPDWSYVEGQELSAMGVGLMIVVGIALGAALSEELLYRGVVLRSLESYGRLRAALASSLLFGLAHLSLLAVGVSVVEALVVAVSSMIVAIGLAAIAFRIGTLWPLIGWHFLQDSGPAFLTAEAIGVYSTVYALLALGLAVGGIWLLWQDRDRSIEAEQHDARAA